MALFAVCLLLLFFPLLSAVRLSLLATGCVSWSVDNEHDSFACQLAERDVTVVANRATE